MAKIPIHRMMGFFYRVQHIVLGILIGLFVGVWTVLVVARRRTVLAISIAATGLHPRRGIDQVVDSLAGPTDYSFLLIKPHPDRHDWRGGHRFGTNAHMHLGRVQITHLTAPISLQSRRRPYAGIAMTA